MVFFPHIMKAKLFILPLLIIVLSINVCAINSIIEPSTPLDNQDLLCYVDDATSQDNVLFTWYINGEAVTSPLVYKDSEGSHLPNTLTSAGDEVVCSTQVVIGAGFPPLFPVSDSVIIQPGLTEVPVAVASVNDNTLKFGQVATFDGSDSTGDGLSYRWTFGDGYSSNLRITYYSYSEVGVYTARLTVTDVNGNSDTDSLVITVSEEGTPSVVDLDFKNLETYKNKFSVLSSNFLRDENVYVKFEVVDRRGNGVKGLVGNLNVKVQVYNE